MGIAFEDVETETGGVLGLERGGEGGRMCEPFPNADCGSALEIPPMIPRLLRGSFPTKRVNLLAVFPGLPPIMDMVIRGKYRLRMSVPGVPTAT